MASKLKLCEYCGFTWEEFKTRKRLGCPGCYKSFHNELKLFFIEYHGKFVASSDKIILSSASELSLLREELSLSLQNEDFKKAHTLKTKISFLEQKHGSD
jgi:protein arginine kinase activator